MTSQNGATPFSWGRPLTFNATRGKPSPLGNSVRRRKRVLPRIAFLRLCRDAPYSTPARGYVSLLSILENISREPFYSQGYVNSRDATSLSESFAVRMTSVES